jgi:hypothetical protein
MEYDLRSGKKRRQSATCEQVYAMVSQARNSLIWASSSNPADVSEEKEKSSLGSSLHVFVRENGPAIG